MKLAIVEIAAVNLRCPMCNLLFITEPDPLFDNRTLIRTWLREDFTGQREIVECPTCHGEIEIPTYAEVFGDWRPQR